MEGPAGGLDRLDDEGNTADGNDIAVFPAKESLQAAGEAERSCTRWCLTRSRTATAVT
jgi:hypothetical protein